MRHLSAWLKNEHLSEGGRVHVLGRRSQHSPSALAPLGAGKKGHVAGAVLGHTIAGNEYWAGGDMASAPV